MLRSCHGRRRTGLKVRDNREWREQAGMEIGRHSHRCKFEISKSQRDCDQRDG